MLLNYSKTLTQPGIQADGDHSPEKMMTNHIMGSNLANVLKISYCTATLPVSTLTGYYSNI